ncbi:MAG: glycine--tRNA ligase [Nanoarchaeota archaeon]
MGKKGSVGDKLSIDELAAFCKRKGFVFSSSEIYGGLAGFWDLGPFGVELMSNIKQSWWSYFVHQQENMTGIDASIISHPKTWEASGHVSSFADVAAVCKKCKKATKIDKSEVGKLKCGCGGEYSVQGEFNLLFKTNVGALNPIQVYLRGETAQGMFLDFKQVAETARVKLPFGIAQIGKCFRNEIAPRDFLFRSREFTIGEFEFFIHPEEKKCSILEKKHLQLNVNLLDAETQEKKKDTLKEVSIEKMIKDKKLDEWHAYWLAEQILWFRVIGIADKVKIREHMMSELSHYSSATFDLDYEYPFGSKELGGNANRGQYDLTQHMKHSNQKLEIFDEATKQRVIPRVIEPTFGMERIFLAVLCNAYKYDERRQNIVLKIPAFLAPVKAAVLPIVKDRNMMKTAIGIYNVLKKDWLVEHDEGGSIGRRYSRNDELGTPMCIAVDEQSVKDKTVTLRDRDTTKQVRVKIEDISEVVRKVISGESLLKLGKIVETRVKEN